MRSFHNFKEDPIGFAHDSGSREGAKPRSSDERRTIIFIKIDEALAETNPASSINRSATKHPSLPGVEGSPDRLARFTARGIPPERVTGNSSKKLPARHPKKPDISERPTRAPAQARRQLYAKVKFMEILAPGRGLPAQRRGGQLHRKPGNGRMWCTIS